MRVNFNVFPRRQLKHPNVAKRLECGAFPRSRPRRIMKKRWNTPHSRRFAQFGDVYADMRLADWNRLDAKWAEP